MGLQICILPLSRDSDYFAKTGIFCKTFGTCDLPANFDKFLKCLGILVKLTTPILLANLVNLMLVAEPSHSLQRRSFGPSPSGDGASRNYSNKTSGPRMC